MANKKVSRGFKGVDYRVLLIVVASVILLPLALAWVSTGAITLSVFLSFVALFVMAIALFWLCFLILDPDNPPRWILLLTLGAILFRLSLGVTWYTALPVAGYDTEVQQSGYVMEDAFNRDAAAWDLAKSDQSLLFAFQGFSSTDQYGGLLFLSAAIYRYLAADIHLPLLIVLLSATVSGLAVLFTWACAQRIWGKRIASIAAWGVALYPEAALLGSSQMREAFTVFLVPLALYGLLRWREKRKLANIILLAAPIALSVPITWAFTPSLILILVLVYLALSEWKILRSWKSWAVIAVILVLVVIALNFVVNVQDLWLVQSAKWQTYISANASGWIARQFDRLPIYGQIPFLVIYGVFRPILPAALVDTGPTIWAAIGIWRAMGWTLLLAMLVYASYLAFKYKEWLRVPGALLISSWIVTIAASYRGGGDLWDSPRYRSAFAAIQVLLASWAWVRYQETKDPWLRRAVVGIALMVVWFIPWYLRRYTAFDWPIVELYQVIGLGIVSAVLFVFWDWLRQPRQS